MNQLPKEKTLNQRIHNWLTKARIPLIALPIIALVAYIHELKYFFIGFGVVVFGELIQMWATSHLHKDQKLTISGPYSHVRNPMYFGRFFVGLGFLTMTGSLYVIAAYVIYYAFYFHFRVDTEENRLREIFGEPYIHYCSEVHRLLPKIKPYSRSENRRASWKQVMVNHEHLVAIGILLGCIIIYLRILTIPGYWPN